MAIPPWMCPILSNNFDVILFSDEKQEEGSWLLQRGYHFEQMM